MKKLLSILIFVVLFSGIALAQEGKHDVGMISNINVTEDEFKVFLGELSKSGKVRFYSSVHTPDETPIFVFYDSSVAMTMALNAGEIDEIFVPECVGEYMINSNENYFEACVIRAIPVSYSFGFRKSDDPELKNNFNKALTEMKADGTLSTLLAKYVYEAGVGDPEPVKFPKFDNPERSIKVAVTGDLPPLDFVAADGTPAGFNTAILAEIAKRLKFNVELISIESGARSASLASKRSDVVFWFQIYREADSQPDLPDGIVLSEPYYTFNEFLHIGLKK